MVTHDLEKIKNDCDCAMFLNKGKIIAIGEPEKVVEAYISNFSK